GSQPWPMPRSLMLGFVARARGEQEIVVDGEEIAEARWFTREELLAGGTSREVLLPPPVSIAPPIIESWYGAPPPRAWCPRLRGCPGCGAAPGFRAAPGRQAAPAAG